MSVDAFGRESMTLLELVRGLTDVVDGYQHLATQPVWVKGPTLFWPVRNVLVNPQGRIIVEVHLK